MRTHLKHLRGLTAVSITAAVSIALLSAVGLPSSMISGTLGVRTACGCEVTKGWLRVELGSEGKTVESFKTVGEEKPIYIIYNGTGSETERLKAVKELFENNQNGSGESYITFNQKDITKCLTLLFTSSEILCTVYARYAKERPAASPVAKAKFEIEPGKSPNVVTLLA